jgi:ribose transport system ATP-binding protein
MENDLILDVQEISKVFTGTVALNQVSFSLRKGEVHALLGENGAGKSTLIKILSGVYTPTDGNILFEGKPISITSPAEAQAIGITTIHQELNLAKDMNAAENMFLGREPKNRFGFIDFKRMYQETADVLEQLGLKIDPKAVVGTLSVQQQQMLKIAEAISKKSKILILDEPTAALTQKEGETLFDFMKLLKNQGVSMIFISHFLNEVFQISDRVTVLRDGKKVGTFPTGEVDREQLIIHMAGKELIEDLEDEAEAFSGEVSLEVSDLTVPGKLKDISFSAHEGEILGIAGLMGAGRTELALSLYGAMHAVQGEVRLFGKKVRIKNPRDAVKNGFAYVPEERKAQGLFLNHPVRTNISLPRLPRLSRNGWISENQERMYSEHKIEEFNVKCPSDTINIMNLSGGNQQKAILARWIGTDPSVLMLDEPTRGIDVSAKADIHRQIKRLAAEGMTVILISSDIVELIALSHRILVLREGMKVGEVSRADATQQKILAMAMSD